MPTELDEMRRMIEDARRAFRARARAVLREAYERADRISTAVGDVSPDQAFAAWADDVKQLLSQ